MKHQLKQSVSELQKPTIGEIRDAAQNKINSPDGGDQFLQKFGEAILVICKSPDDSQIANELLTLAAERIKIHNETPAETLHFLSRWIQYQHLDDKDYPENHSTVEAWRQSIAKCLLGHTSQRDKSKSMYEWVVQGNYAPRYKCVPLAYYLYEQTPGHNATVFDFGTGNMRGLRALAHSQKYALEPVTLMVEPERNKVISDGPISEHPELSAAINPHIKSMPLGSCIGIDALKPNSNGGLSWSLATSRRPSEWKDDRIIKQIIRNEAEVEGVRFAQADFTNEAELAKAIGGNMKADIITMFFSFYQIKSIEKQAKAIELAKKYLLPHGLLLVIDSSAVDPTSPTGISFFQYRYSKDIPYSIKLLVFSMAQPKLGFQELAAFSDGRCYETVLNKDHPAVIKFYKKNGYTFSPT